MFAKEHNYVLAIDEETAWYIVNQRQPGKPMDGNFNIPRMLIMHEVAYEKTTTKSGVDKSRDLAKMFQSVNTSQTSGKKDVDHTMEANNSMAADISGLDPSGQVIKAKVKKNDARKLSGESLLIESETEEMTNLVIDKKARDKPSKKGDQAAVDTQRTELKMLTQKYLKFSDFLDFQLKIYRERCQDGLEDGYTPVLLFCQSMLDVVDFDKSAILWLENDMYDLFLDMEVYCVVNDFLLARESLIQSFFIAAIKLDQLSKAVHIARVFEANLLQCAAKVVPPLIIKLRDNKFY